jgi:hypothetical protein
MNMVVCRFTIPETERVELVAQFLAGWTEFHGGLTAWDAQGSWVSDTKDTIVSERVTVVEIALEVDKVQNLRASVIEMGRLLDQEAVYFVVGTEAEVIECSGGSA